MIRKKKAEKPKVTLRFKLLGTGRESLYLDYYPAIKDLGGDVKNMLLYSP